MLERALKFAKVHHAGQVDKAGADYFTGHIMTVVANAKTLTKDPIIHTAAALHDVVEDTPVTIEEVAELFGEEVAVVVGLVTKSAGIPKSEYFRAIKENDRATIVKIADMTHNTDLGRLAIVTEADRARNAVYMEWMEYLA